MSEVGNGSQTYDVDVESDEEESSRQDNDDEESEDGYEDEDFEEDGEAGNFEDSGTDEDEESDDGGEAGRCEELHCYRCKAELNVNCTDVITYCRPCVDDNCKEMSMLGSSVAENQKTVALLKEQLAKITPAVAALRYQVTTKQAETQRLTMELKVAKLEARDAKKHLREALASRKRPLQRLSSEAPPC